MFFSSSSSSSSSSWSGSSAPEGIVDVRVVDQNSSSIRLQWDVVENITTYRVEYTDSGGNNSNSTVEVEAGQEVVNYTASALRSATYYTFTVYSVLDYTISSGLSFTAVTGTTLLVVSILMVTQIPSSPW